MMSMGPMIDKGGLIHFPNYNTCRVFSCSHLMTHGFHFPHVHGAQPRFHGAVHGAPLRSEASPMVEAVQAWAPSACLGVDELLGIPEDEFFFKHVDDSTILGKVHQIESVNP